MIEPKIFWADEGLEDETLEDEEACALTNEED